MSVTTGVRKESLHPDVCWSSAVFPFHQLGSVGFQCAGLIFCVCEQGTMALFGKNLSVQRCLTFATGLVECLCFAGAVFGWASLVFVLKSENYFSSLCVNTTDSNGTQVLGEFQHLTSSPRVAVCRPTSLKDSRSGLKLWCNSFFLSVSQTAAAKMNSSLWCSPPPPL